MAGHLHGTWNVSQHLATLSISPRWRNYSEWRQEKKFRMEIEWNLCSSTEVNWSQALSLTRFPEHLLAISRAIDVLPAEDQRGPSQGSNLLRHRQPHISIPSLNWLAFPSLEDYFRNLSRKQCLNMAQLYVLVNCQRFTVSLTKQVY